jgi:AcrR family transcriptional regulator
MRQARSVEGTAPAPTRLDRETILDAAEAVVGAEGAASLTMRRIGRELGADPTALYRHFRSKDELLEMLAERMFSDAPVIDEDAPWRGELKRQLTYGLNRYRGVHPDLARVLARQRDDSHALREICDGCIRLLRRAGLTVADAAMMFHLIENHVVGNGLYYSLLESQEEPRLSDPERLREAYAVGASHDGQPDAAAAAPHLFPDLDEIYDQGSELLLDAIERLALKRPATPTTEGPAR